MHNLVDIFLKDFEDGKTDTVTFLMDTNVNLYCIHCSEGVE